MAQARVPIRDALAKIPIVDDIRIDKLDLGERPFRVDSFKTYQTLEDEIIIEAPTFWGGDMHIRATAVLKLGGVLVDVPVDVSDISFKVLARIIIKPLVETLPCVGGVTLALLEDPVVDCTVNILDSPDIMAIPPVPLVLKAGIKVVAGKMLMYPNEFCVPLMPGFGLPPPPQGMLRVRVVCGHGMKSSLLDKVDPFVTLEIRKGRSVRTRTINNNTDPTWDEDLDLVVDDPATQALIVTVLDDDLVSPDVVGGVRLPLSTAAFIQTPHETIIMRLPVYALGDEEDAVFPEAGHGDLVEAVQAAATDKAVAEAVAALPKRRGLIGKLMHRKAAKEASQTILSAHSGGAPSPRDGGFEGGGESEVEDVERVTYARGTVTGNLTLEMTYTPFAAAQPPPVEAAPAEDSAVKEGEKPAEAPTPPVASIRKVVSAGDQNVLETECFELRNV